jgi:hypothetical protein
MDVRYRRDLSHVMRNKGIRLEAFRKGVQSPVRQDVMRKSRIETVQFEGNNYSGPELRSARGTSLVVLCTRANMMPGGEDCFDVVSLFST